MAMPSDILAIDTMIGFPARDLKAQYAFITKQTKDAQSMEEFEFPAEYMFKAPPDKEKELRESTDPVGYTLEQMDRWGIGIGMVGVGSRGEDGGEATGEDAIRRYAKACELDIPVFVCTGIPGPRLKFQCQHVEHVDEVMYDFPELTYVSRHGCQPWTELMVKLMLKWPGLHYSTSAFAPKHYDPRIIDYANSRGGDKIIYAGYFPMGLSLERIMTEMRNVPFKDEVWPKFLRGNAARVLKLDV